MLNGTTSVNHTESSYSAVACQFKFFFTLSVSQTIRHKLKNSANRRGVELGFHANTWCLNFAG